MEKIFDELYRGVDGKSISLTARAKRSSWYIGYTYGEITYQGFKKILSSANHKNGEIFYDLGSGTGKVVFASALIGNFSSLTGVEIIKELYESSQNTLTKYKDRFKQLKKVPKAIKFINADFKDIDFSDADIIFMNATCMGYEFSLPFIRKFANLKKGFRLITTTGYVPIPGFAAKNIGLIDFNWGKEEVFIQEKL